MSILPYSPLPRTVFLEIIYGCNLYCAYCYIGRYKNHEQPLVPSYEILKDILHEIHRINVDEVVLLGGEPMLHPNIEDICNLIAELHFPYRGIVTNGTALSDDIEKTLIATGFWVDITFRGPDSTTFDAVTGEPGVYNKALESAVRISQSDIPIGIEFDCTPTSYTLLLRTIRNLLNAGVEIKQVLLHRILPRGEAKNKIEKFSLNIKEWEDVFEQALIIQEKLNVPIFFEDGFPFCLVDSKYWGLLISCGCGFNTLAVDPAGNARFCLCHGEVLGNVLVEPIERIWENSLNTYRLTSRLPLACRDCDLIKICKGGCSASGGLPMNISTDTFRDNFHSVKQKDCQIPMKILLGQTIRSRK